ncbi:MAG: YihY/virulence factor BrkB family protein [Acidobacteria bacterium]|nr:YihY/virulence factor BrkB family protein [Acidobacteriota bacterium]
MTENLSTTHDGERPDPPRKPGPALPTFPGRLARSWKTFLDDGGPVSAAAIAYYALFTLFPGILALLGLGQKLLLGDERGRMAAYHVLALLPAETRRYFESLFLSLTQQPSWEFIIGNVVVFLWMGLWVFHLLADALDKAWDVPPRPSFLRRTLVGLWMIVFCTLCLLASASLMALIHVWRFQFPAHYPTANRFLFGAVLNLSAYLFLALMFTGIYRVVPNTRVAWGTAFRGGFFAGFLWHVTNWALTWVIPAFDYQRVYGPLSAAVVFLFWVGVSFWILIYGAHLTFHSQADRHGGSRGAGP